MTLPKSLCIIHGNCQGETLAALLGASPEFAAAFDVEYYVNFTRQAIPEQSLARCGLFLHQELGGHWGDVSSRALKLRLRPGAASVCFPNMLFKGYWPFWSNREGFDYSDSLLDALLERGLAPAEILRVAVGGDPDKLAGPGGLGESLRGTLERERAKEKTCNVAYVDMIEELFRVEKLFMSVNHPGKRLMLWAADAVLRILGMEALPEAFRQVCPQLYTDFELPIHPKVAAFHGLRFAGEGTRFPVYGSQLTYGEYVSLYIDCKLSGRSDFIAYLQGA